jgi:hypothetical protein
MSEAGLTVGEALSSPDPNAKAGTPDTWTDFQNQVKAQMKGVKWVATMPDVAEMLGELFDIPIPGLLLGSWRKADELAQLLKESEESPEEVMYLELAEHRIDRELHPYIEIRIENIDAYRLDFTVHLSFKLKGFVLRIQKGQIQEILSAQCEFGGSVELLNHTVLKKDFTPINLPASIRLFENHG